MKTLKFRDPDGSLILCNLANLEAVRQVGDHVELVFIASRKTILPQAYVNGVHGEPLYRKPHEWISYIEALMESGE